MNNNINYKLAFISGSNLMVSTVITLSLIKFMLFRNYNRFNILIKSTIFLTYYSTIEGVLMLNTVVSKNIYNYYYNLINN